jgi:biopolymer transport protein TolR
MAQLHKGRRLMGDINVVPYIDVMLVLLIIFMVTAPLLAQGVKVDLPKASAEPLPPDAEDPLVLSIDKQGRMYLNVGATPNAPIDEEVVMARTAAALRRSPEKPVLLKADEAIAYGRAVDAMVILQRAGAKKVGFITEPIAERKPYGAQPSAGASGDATPANARPPTSAGAAAPSNSKG